METRRANTDQIKTKNGKKSKQQQQTRSMNEWMEKWNKKINKNKNHINIKHILFNYFEWNGQRSWWVAIWMLGEIRCIV